MRSPKHRAGGSGTRRRSASGTEVGHAVQAGGELGRQNGHEGWMERVKAEGKLDRLFELDALLRGLGCFANPRNHPGGPHPMPMVGQDFREHTALVREGLARVVQLCRELAADHERAFVFQGYLESVTPDDATRNRLVRGAGAEDGPERSLITLRQGMSHVLEAATGIARLPRVTFRAFHAVLALAQREIARSTHFRPSEPFECRPEFDCVSAAPGHDLVRSAMKDQARRVLAHMARSSSRMLRYVSLVESMAAPPSGTPLRRAAAGVHLVLAVLRSDARVIATTLRRRSGRLFAAVFEGEVMAVGAPEMSREYARLLERGDELYELRSALDNLGANLRLEVQRVFEHDLRPLDAGVALEAFLGAAHAAVGKLRPTLRNVSVRITQSLIGGIELDAALDGDLAHRASSEGLRRDVWLFAKVFQTLAERTHDAAKNEAEGWEHESPLSFVREFASYFKATAYPLLRPTDAPRVGPFLRTLRDLDDADSKDGDRLKALGQEASRFSSFLDGLFQEIGRRNELAGRPFDEAAAAEILGRYLSA